MFTILHHQENTAESERDDNKQTINSHNNYFPQQIIRTDEKTMLKVKRLNALLSWKKNSGLSLSTFTFLNFFQQQLHEVLQCFDVLNSTKCWFLSARWQESLEIFRHKMSSDVHCFVIHVRKINCVSHLVIQKLL